MSRRSGGFLPGRGRVSLFTRLSCASLGCEGLGIIDYPERCFEMGEQAEDTFHHVDLLCRGVHIGSGKSEHHCVCEATPRMARTREQLVRDAAARGKYAPLFRHLVSTSASPEWRTTFGEIEAILGFRLPDSARLYRPWWSNQNKGAGHSHALSWHAAGWKTCKVDIEAETLVFARVSPPVGKRRFDIDEFWPPVRGRLVAAGVHREPRADVRRVGAPDRRAAEHR